MMSMRKNKLRRFQICIINRVYDKIGASYDAKRVFDMCNEVYNVEISKFDFKCLEFGFLMYFIEFSVKNNVD